MPAFLLPDLGEGLTEAEIVAWRVRVGDTVTVDQPVVEVETAKAVVEVPVPFAGQVTVLHGQPGDVLTVGSPLITVDDQQADSGSAAVGAFSEPGLVTAPPAGSGPGETQEESGAVLIGYGTSGSARRCSRRAAATAPAPAGLASPPGTSERGTAPPLAAPAPAGQPGAAAGNGVAAAPPRGHRITVVSPLVRKLARDHGLDLAGVAGSGSDGLILRRDVDAAIAAQAAPAALDGTAAPAPD